MRIQSIEIENITSLKGLHKIDFSTGLQGGDLFAITGPTGSGKSSILSAISLALYGKTYKGGLASNDFVTTGKAFARVQLDFSLGGKAYQANWMIKILKKNGEDIKAPKPQRELICEGVILDQVSITDILGLDFDQFCKTIILNQGEFSKFLHSSFKDRKDIIEKLYRTQDLSKLGKLLKEKVKREETQLEFSRLNFENALPYSEEEVVQIKKELAAQLISLDFHEKLSGLFLPAFDVLKKLKVKLTEGEDYKGRSNKAQESLRKLVEELNSSKTLLERTERSYQKNLELSKSEAPKLREAIKFQTKTLSDQKTLDGLRSETSEKELKLKSLNIVFSSKKEEIEKLEKSLKVDLASYKLIKLFKNSTKNEIYTFKEDIRKLNSYLAEVQRVNSQREILLKQISTQKSFGLKLAQKLKELLKKSKDSRILKEDPDELRRKREGILTLWNNFEHHCASYKENLKNQEVLCSKLKQLELSEKELRLKLEILTKLKQENSLSSAVNLCILEANKKNECPVCQNNSLPSKLPSLELDKNFTELDFDQSSSQLDKNKFDLDQTKQSLKLNQDQARKTLSLLEKNKNNIFQGYKESLNWKTFSEVDQGLKILKELYLSNQRSEQARLEELVKLTHEKAALKSEATTSNNLLTQLEASQTELDQSAVKVEALIALFLNNWKDSLENNKSAQDVTDDFASDIETFNKVIQGEQKIESGTELLNSTTSQVTEIEQRLKAIAKLIQELEALIKINTEQVQKLCKDKNPISLLEQYEKEEKQALKEFQAAKDNKFLVEKKKNSEDQNIRIFNEQIVDIQNLQNIYIKEIRELFASLLELKQTIPEAYILAESSRELINASAKWSQLEASATENLLPILESRLEGPWQILTDKLSQTGLELKTSSHTNKNRIKEYNQKLDDRADLEKEINTIKSSLQIKNKLLEVFGKDEFRSYALGLLEKELVFGANQELIELCDGRYELELRQGRSNQMDFFVLDRWREGTLRKINTLSGGETFLVSLAMALALAELTRGKSEIDSFFIDEGFGHLDTDSIDEVLEVLMNIQNRGKQIGIISHVKVLTDRIPVNLKLQKTSLGESSIEFSYN